MEIKAADLFNIDSERRFNELALDIFRYQAAKNEVYSEYLKGLRLKAEEIDSVAQIPFLPIGFFKTHKVCTKYNGSASSPQVLQSTIFTSSGTSGDDTSKHYVHDISLYEESFRKGFELFYGKPKEYRILALLPSYLEREGSSLVYMLNDLIKQSADPESGFYLHNLDELAEKLKQKSKKKTLLLGVTYALLDLAEKIKGNGSENLIVMETGGMKGKRKEMVREELHETLCASYGVKKIHSEYGMTELLSQAYSKSDGIFNCPPWMKVSARDVNDPFSAAAEGKTGGINVIDLANVHSCSFIATQDLGKVYADGSVEILGRFDNSDLRGCNLMSLS